MTCMKRTVFGEWDKAAETGSNKIRSEACFGRVGAIQSCTQWRGSS